MFVLTILVLLVLISKIMTFAVVKNKIILFVTMPVCMTLKSSSSLLFSRSM